MTSAAEHAAALQDKAREAQQADPNHADCATPLWDAEYGPICGCGTMLAELAQLQHSQLPASSVTADAQGSRQAEQEGPGTAITTTEGVASAVHPADPITAAVEVIDPTAPYDSAMVEEHMLDVMARLERGAHYQRVCEEDRYNAELAYEMAHAHAIVEADKHGGASDVRAARAKIACEGEYTRLLIAKMKVDAIRQTMHSLRSVLSGYQSVAKSISSTYSGGGSNRPAF